ncbi:hypothetical protein [Streptosporangium minutum]|uniref:Uncharacterized protein n=1 Tax=Streptosporangium minutum TaxID=569862 RepID=A0A243RP90_9ACTN|nr:hypothetical protein [Streptosporangium minutum]OUC96808.1 hypothetical protein CA984_13480 [Streptosporangium minutum]
MIASSILTGSLLLAVGCGAAGHSTATTGTATVDSPSRPVSHTVAPREEPTQGPKPTKPQGHTDNPRKVRWLTAKPSKDGRSLRITWWSGVEPCTVLDRVSVKETSRRVTVTLWEGPSAKAKNMACIAIAIQKVTTVKLKAPLGKRKIVDGAKP